MFSCSSALSIGLGRSVCKEGGWWSKEGPVQVLMGYIFNLVSWPGSGFTVT